MFADSEVITNIAINYLTLTILFKITHSFVHS